MQNFDMSWKAYAPVSFKCAWNPRLSRYLDTGFQACCSPFSTQVDIVAIT